MHRHPHPAAQLPETHAGPVAISCAGLSVRLGGREVLHGINLAVRKGSFLPVVGPNGAGKTTLLRAVAGLVAPSAGTVRVFPEGRAVGYVPQQKSIDPIFPLSVADIVGMGLIGQSRANHGADINKACERIGIGDLVGRDFATLSGGQKQRALIARALVTGAEVLVFDEPASELDEETECALLDLLAAMCRDEGCTVLIAHHGLSHVRLHAPEVCLVRHGEAKLVPSGEAEF